MITTTQPQAGVTRTVTVPCRQGVHLRVASVIVTMARQFRSAIHFVTASGQDADRAVQVLGDLFESKGVLCRDAWEMNGWIRN